MAVDFRLFVWLSLDFERKMYKGKEGNFTSTTLLITFKVLLHIIKKRISITAEKFMSGGTMMTAFACIKLWGMMWNLTKA